MYVRCQKLHPTNAPLHSTAREDNYDYGAMYPESSPPVGYWVTGEAMVIVVGSPIYVARDSRNGVSVKGTFVSSPVTKVTDTAAGTLCETKNSVYLVTEVEK